MKPKHPLTVYREAHDLTLAELATKIRVRPNTVWRWENGRLPRAQEWPKIKRATGIEAAELVAFQESAA